MSDWAPSDDTWEDFFGAPTELMPTIMGALDAIIENSRKNKEPDVKPCTPRRSHQVSNFANLSPCVQKILSNVPDQELSKHFSSEETLQQHPKRTPNRSSVYRSLRSPEKYLNKSSESLDIISPNVQKMISNFQDNELVTPTCDKFRAMRNGSFLHNNSSSFSDDTCENSKEDSLIDDNNCECDRSASETDNSCDNSVKNSHNNNSMCEVGDNYSPKPLGTYLHTPHGIASRTPVGRKNMGKFLQVPSESSVGTCSTISSEVSRPVSLTSLGSCSSSSSGGPNQPNSAYLASAESLDSDPEPIGSQGSADSGIAEQSTMTPEARVLQEVLDTETVYVSDLNEVIQGYLQPWKNDPDCALTNHLPHLFNNLEEIYKFNKNFLDQLRATEGNSSKTANVFIQNDSGFTIYSEYCTNYPRTMDLLGQLTRDEAMAALFREKQTALGHALPLGSYLLKPVQRILKYHILLQRLSKQCEPLHKPVVDLALTTMTAVASSINNMKRKHEHAVRVHEIQAQLYGWDGPDLAALGELIAEGTFRVNGAKGRRHVFLFDKVLLMAKSKQDGALAYKTHIMCSNLMLVEQVRGEPLSFQILPFDNPRLQCTLRARSPQHKREWTLQIKRVILENYNADIPNHAKQLVMQLGQDIQTSEESSDKWSPLNKNSTPHYLERRCRVRKSRSDKRASSQDRAFPSLGGWRRKSEPSMSQIPQYDTKTIPKKISKMKQSKATFYTDLSDTENGDSGTTIICESTESLPTDNLNVQEETQIEINNSKNNNKSSSDVHENVENNLEKIVSDLLMQNQEFHKLMHRQRRNLRSSEPEPVTWLLEEDRSKLPCKADSLPRSFQLNDQIDEKTDEKHHHHHQRHILDESLKENPDDEDRHENDLSSQLDDNNYPVHKIYRKSAIRLSLLQRIRALVSEEDKRNSKYPLWKQGSKNMGEKIANPDYVDPKKLFINSCNSSRTNLTLELNEIELMGEHDRLDMTISENEVLNEFEKRLNSTNHGEDAGQNSTINTSSHSDQDQNVTVRSSDKSVIESSQNSDSYYETILESNLIEEYVKDRSGKLIAKQDSFKSNETKIYEKRSTPVAASFEAKRCNIKRPTKAPPPIPTKPSRLIINSKSETAFSKTVRTHESTSTHLITSSTDSSLNNSKGKVVEKSWVKEMVGRFE